MYLKSLIMIALITALYACPFTSAFVSEYFANHRTVELEESNKENAVVDEGTFVAVYSGQENFFGESIMDISDCDVAVNTLESSGAETVDSAEDIVTGEESGMLEDPQGKNDISKKYDAKNYDGNIVGNTNDEKKADNNNASLLAGNGNGGIDVNKTPAVSGQLADNKASTESSQSADSKISTASSQSADSKISTESSQLTDSKASTESSQPVGSSTSATSGQPVANNANTGENSSGNNDSTTGGGTEYGETYRHNTSIYEDDSLIRVEYYDDDNNLYEYSDVTDYSAENSSYTETVYRYDEENDVEVPVRKDTYVNGVLVSSEYY